MGEIERDARLGAALRRLVELAAADPLLRDGLEALAEMIGSMRSPVAAREEAVDAAAPAEPPSSLVAVDVLGSTEAPPVEAATPLVEEPTPARGEREETRPMDRAALVALVDAALALRPPESVTPPVAPAQAPASPTIDVVDRDEALTGIRDRAALKAELTRAVMQRTMDGTPVPGELLHRARSAGASTWPMDLLEAGPETLGRLAAVFDAVADAVDLVHLLRSAAERDRSRIEPAMRTLAAVQSALRVQVAGLRRWPDEEQVSAFEWLRDITQQERIFIERHMRLDDPLDPESVEEVMEDVRDQLDRLREAMERQETRTRQLKRLRYHAQRLAKGKGTDDDLEKVIDATCAAVDAGVPPSSLDIREQLTPLLSRLPEESVPRQLQLVLREIHLAQEAATAARKVRIVPERADNGEIATVARLLRGSRLVMIGGEERVEARQSLIEAFQLEGLDWLTLSDDPTPDELERVIGRPGISVVLYLIRWARHAYGNARLIADEHDVPFVRIPGGYNEAAVAHEILEQASERLKARGPASSAAVEEH